MFPSYRKYAQAPLRRRAIGWLALVVYLAAAFGFPVPDLAGPLSGTPFPCQGHGCGCRSAQHCWTDCCCFTPREKEAWAQRNGVTVPSDAEQVEPETPPAKKKSCCGGAHDPPQASSGASAKLTKAGCCSVGKPTTPGCCSAQQEPTAPGGRSAPSPWQQVFNTFKCRGLGSTWLAIPEVGAPPPPLLGYAVLLAHTGRVAEVNLFVAALSFPPTPPPG